MLKGKDDIQEEIEATIAARHLLEAAGFVVLKEKSYRQAQERQRRAECYRDAEIRAAESAREWARDCLKEERRLAERCTFLYGVARSHGATEDELRGPGGRVLEELDRIDMEDDSQ
jgi:hypothetical protein